MALTDMRNVFFLMLCSFGMEFFCLSSHLRDPTPVNYSGQANIAIFTSVHVPGRNMSLCGPLRREAVQEVMAAIWAVQQMNKWKSPNDMDLGVYIYDTCGRRDVTKQQILRLLPMVGGLKYTTCQTPALPSVFGIIVGEESKAIETAGGIFNVLSSPVFITGRVPEDLELQENVFTTALPVAYRAKVVADVVKVSGFKKIGLAATRDSDFNAAQQTLEDAGINVVHVKIAGMKTVCSQENLPRIGEVDVEAVALFLTDSHVLQVFDHIEWKNSSMSVLISTDRDLTSRLQDSLLTEHLSDLSNVLFLWPSSSEVLEFETYFRNMIQGITEPTHPLVKDLWNSMNDTRGQEFVHKGFIFPGVMASFTLPSSRKVSTSHESLNTIKAVWTLALGLRAAQQRQCHGKDCLPGQKSLGRVVLQALQNYETLLLKTPVRSLHDRNIMFDDVFPNFGQIVLTNLSFTGSFQEIGRYSSKMGLITREDVLLRRRTTTFHHHTPLTSFDTNHENKLCNLPSSSHKRLENVKAGNVKSYSFGAWMTKTWCSVCTALSGTGILVTGYVLALLLVKVCDKTVKMNAIVISVFQLIALIMMYLGALLFTFQPSFTTCSTRKVVHNVAYAFNYGCLLLRGMTLRSQKALGLGGSVNQANQILTLLYVVGAQVALEVQWWIFHPPEVKIDPKQILECSISKRGFLVCQTYIMFLLLLAVLMTFFVRNCYQEGYCVTVTSLLSLTVFFVWVVAFALLPEDEYGDFATCVAQISTATVILGGIFGPQLYSLRKHRENFREPLFYADSLSTIFTMFKDIDSTSGQDKSPLRREKFRRTLEPPYSGEVVQTSLFNKLKSSYP
ncbi:uncharacterized protein LOC143238195 [Tachypleus tridentatus]|uniref:uncharacterized protein LOC143238195 n=1 Tax=Tachypleus tridentatus TaxID=6853 RepID=UPI003FD0C5BE